MGLIDPEWIKEHGKKHTQSEIDSLGIELYCDKKKIRPKPGQTIEESLNEQEGEQQALL